MARRFFTCPLCVILRPAESPPILRPGICQHERTGFISYVKSAYAVCLTCVDERTCIYCGNVVRDGEAYIKALESRRKREQSENWLGKEIINGLFSQNIQQLKKMTSDDVIKRYSREAVK